MLKQTSPIFPVPPYSLIIAWDMQGYDRYASLTAHETLLQRSSRAQINHQNSKI
jgi:hypothetical protein